MSFHTIKIDKKHEARSGNICGTLCSHSFPTPSLLFAILGIIYISYYCKFYFMKMTIELLFMSTSERWEKKYVKQKRNVWDDAIAILCLILISITTLLSSSHAVFSLTPFHSLGVILRFSWMNGWEVKFYSKNCATFTWTMNSFHPRFYW